MPYMSALNKLNLAFTTNELKLALASCSKSNSCGTDEIPYIVLQHLGSHVTRFLLNVFNNFWENGYVPDDWKHALSHQF